MPSFPDGGVVQRVNDQFTCVPMFHITTTGLLCNFMLPVVSFCICFSCKSIRIGKNLIRRLIWPESKRAAMEIHK